MYNIARFFNSVRLPLIILSVLAQGASTTHLQASPSNRALHPVSYLDCSAALPLHEGPWTDDRLGPNEHRFFSIDLDQPGLLNAEANGLESRDALPTLEILDAQCRPLGGAFAMHRAHRSAIITDAETYYLRVGAPPRARHTNFRLQVAFAPLQTLTDAHALPEDLEEPMDEWEELVGTQDSLMAGGGTLPEDLEEPMDEWEELVGGDNLAALAAFSDWRRAQSPELAHSNAGRWQHLLETALCPRAAHDDHSETLSCASPILLGGSLRAELESDVMADRDSYTFVVERRARVIVRAAGELELRASLIDGNGRSRVRAEDNVLTHDGDFHLDLTLEPGRYYLRVESHNGQQGPYWLQSAITPEAWQLAAVH